MSNFSDGVFKDSTQSWSNSLMDQYGKPRLAKIQIPGLIYPIYGSALVYCF